MLGSWKRNFLIHNLSSCVFRRYIFHLYFILYYGFLYILFRSLSTLLLRSSNTGSQLVMNSVLRTQRADRLYDLLTKRVSERYTLSYSSLTSTKTDKQSPKITAVIDRSSWDTKGHLFTIYNLQFILFHLHLALIFWYPRPPNSMLCRCCRLCSHRNRKINIVFWVG